MTTKRLRRPIYLVVALAIVATAAACAAKTPNAGAPATGPTPQASQSTAPRIPQVIAVSAPPTLGGRPKISDPTHDKLVADLEATVKNDPLVRFLYVAYYGTADARKNKVYLVAVKFDGNVGPSDLQQNLDSLSQGIQGTALVVTDMPEQGDLGGEARCGTIQFQQISVAICGWRVNSYLGLVMWYYHEVKDLVEELPAIRGEVESRA